MVCKWGTAWCFDMALTFCDDDPIDDMFQGGATKCMSHDMSNETLRCLGCLGAFFYIVFFRLQNMSLFQRAFVRMS